MDYASLVSRDAIDLYSFDFPSMEESREEAFGVAICEILKEVGGEQGSVKGERNGRREDWI